MNGIGTGRQAGPQTGRIPRIVRPAVILAGLIAVWQAVVWATGAPPFILPGPVLVAAALESRAGRRRTPGRAGPR